MGVWGGRWEVCILRSNVPRAFWAKDIDAWCPRHQEVGSLQTESSYTRSVKEPASDSLHSELELLRSGLPHTCPVLLDILSLLAGLLFKYVEMFMVVMPASQGWGSGKILCPETLFKLQSNYHYDGPRSSIQSDEQVIRKSILMEFCLGQSST